MSDAEPAISILEQGGLGEKEGRGGTNSSTACLLWQTTAGILVMPSVDHEDVATCDGHRNAERPMRMMLQMVTACRSVQ